ncbi:hypothetical protein EDD85DRAFT_795886 [Armillaria nabsnona]|nr:hypothetical protein EDD85DRAFT_795886 [Armillaria nabsnona]
MDSRTKRHGVPSFVFILVVKVYGVDTHGIGEAQFPHVVIASAILDVSIAWSSQVYIPSFDVCLLLPGDSDSDMPTGIHPSAYVVILDEGYPGIVSKDSLLLFIKTGIRTRVLTILIWKLSTTCPATCLCTRAVGPRMMIQFDSGPLFLVQCPETHLDQLYLLNRITSAIAPIAKSATEENVLARDSSMYYFLLAVKVTSFGCAGVGDPFILPEILESLNGQLHSSEVALQEQRRAVWDPQTGMISNLPHLVAALLSSELMASWISAKGVKSVMKLALSAVINIFVPMLVFYIGKWIGRQPFFEGDKMKQKLRGKHGKAILNKALRCFGIDVWWLGARERACSQYWFDAAGNMVFTAELANRMVDSEAWVYRVNQSKETFDANNYARVISDASTIRSLLDPSTKKALVVQKLTGFNIISSALNPKDLSTLILLLPATPLSAFGTS